MSREIEFRVRCSATKEILGYEHFNACLNAGYYYTDSSKPIDDGDGGIDYICQTEFSEQPMLKSKFFGQLIREQFTGKRDCNGVKVFECDTVKAPCGHVGSVIFSGVSFSVEDYDSGDYYQGQNPDSWDWSKFEVIGNIHQNSELLK